MSRGASSCREINNLTILQHVGSEEKLQPHRRERPGVEGNLEERPDELTQFGPVLGRVIQGIEQN